MVSILMPLYNGLEFLDESIPSVIAQTHKSWELLIGINGHQPHEFNKILEKISKYKDKRIKLFFFKFKNKSKTLNALTYKTKWENICLLDADDVWEPTKLEKQLPFMKRYDVVGTDCEYIGDVSGSPGLFLGRINRLMFSYQNPIVNSAVMIKRPRCDNFFWDENWEGLDDYNLWIDLLNVNKTFYNIPEVLVKIRIHNDSYFNHNNGEMNKKLLEEKIPKLTEEQLQRLGEKMVNKDWDL